MSISNAINVGFVRPDCHQGWRAELSLKFAQQRDKTRLVERHKIGPLAVQRAFYPEGDICHVYLLHPPGGVVGGDQLCIDIAVEKDAHALLTTPGATKFYRSKGDLAWQSQSLRVDENGFLEWLPMENIFFTGAHCRLMTEVHLAENSRFMGWEMQCFGRPALDEQFQQGALQGQLRIYRDTRLLLTETIRIQDNVQLQQAAVMRGFAMTASFYITPVDEHVVDVINQVINQQQTLFSDDILLAASELDGLLVVRALANNTEQIMHSFIAIWTAVRQEWLGVKPNPPRIWAT